MSFKLITPVSDVLRRDFPINASLSSDPTAGATNTKTIAGKWVALLQSASNIQVLGPIAAVGSGVYATGDGDSSGQSGHAPVYCSFTQKGDTAMQAIDKMTILFNQGWEAESSYYSATDSGTGADAPAIGSLLSVNTDGDLCVASLLGHTVVAVCTRGPVAVGGTNHIRFQAVSPYTLQ
jgi:hypothetical protein